MKSATSQTNPPRRVSARGLREAGFTLAEALAALTFMAILIPVALEGLHLASRAGEVAARKSEAVLVAESVLTQTVIATNFSQMSQSGSTRQGAHDFRWTLHNEPWNQDATLSGMRLLSVDVGYLAQGHDYSVHLSTLVDIAPPAIQPVTTQ
jgi:type II secretory pathway pseudopilin PulG